MIEIKNYNSGLMYLRYRLRTFGVTIRVRIMDTTIYITFYYTLPSLLL